MDEPSPTPQASPFLCMWFKPRATMRRLLDDGYDRWNYAIVAIGSIQFANWDPDHIASDIWWPFSLQGLVWIAGAVVVGIVLWLLNSWTITEAAKILGGRASYKKTRGALAWSGLVECLSSLVWMLQYALFNIGSVYAPDFIRKLYLPESLLGLVLLSLPFYVTLVWSFLVRIACISVATDLSLGRSWLAGVLGTGLSVVILIVPAVLCLFAYATFFAPRL